MTAASADRDMLFGTFAIQLEFVTRDQLISATSEWVLNKQQRLREVLLSKGFINRAELQVIENVVQKHVDRNQGDLRQSLDSIAAFQAIRATFEDTSDYEQGATRQPHDAGAPSYDRYVTQAPSPAESVPSISRYTILRPHQKGGLGKVSIALDEELNREVALKEILAAQADSVENRSRFILEAEITGALEHPGIVPVYSLGQYADGRPYYAMRFVHGVNMQVAIDQYHDAQGSHSSKQLQFRQLLGRLVDVCNAMEYAHNRGVIHRDIKPGNIMLGDYGETLVVDWGIAKTMGDEFESDATIEPPVHPTKRASSVDTQVGRVVGTPMYMSPEQAAGRVKKLGPAADIYSLGATLYQLLTGDVPFEGTEDEIIGNVQMGRFPQPRKIERSTPRALEAICLKAMARLPKDRYASARAMADDIERYLADERVLAYAEPFPVKAWRWVRNHRSLVLSSIAAMTVAMVALLAGIILLSAANVRERALRSEAVAQRERAEHNFSMAQDAVREYYILVSEDTLLKQRGMQPLRDLLLKQALEYYQRFLQQREDDPTLRKEVAQAHFFAGRITETVDSADKALPHYQHAAELQDELLGEEPDDDILLFNSGQTLNAIGRAMQKLGRFEEAREYYQQAIKQREKLATAHPDNAEYGRTLASSIMNVGLIHYIHNELERSIELFNRAQTIRLAHIEKLEEADLKMQRDLGKGYYSLALAQLKIGDIGLAESNLQTAIDVFKRLIELDPQDMGNQRLLGISYRMLGDALAGNGLGGEAIAAYHQSITALQSLCERNPDVPEYAADLAGVLMNLGNQLEQADQTDAALEAVQEAVSVLHRLADDFEAMPRYRRDLGVALRFVGYLLTQTDRSDRAREQLVESKMILQQLVREHPSNPDFTTELANTIDALAELDEKGVKEEEVIDEKKESATTTNPKN